MLDISAEHKIIILSTPYESLMYFNSIYAGEFLTRSETVYPVFLAVISGIFRPITAAIPWFYTDERSIFGRRRPKSHHRCCEAKTQPRSSVHTMKCNSSKLTVLKHQRVDYIKCIFSKGITSLSVKFERIFCYSIHTSLSYYPYALKSLCPVEREESALILFKVIIRIIECRMCTDLEIHILCAGIADLPDHIHFVVMQSIAYFKTERPRIFCKSIFGRFKAIAELCLRLTDKCKLHITRKSMLSKRKLFITDPVSSLPDASNNREKDWRVAGPELRICLPEIFGFTFADARKLRTMSADFDCQHIILQCLHFFNRSQVSQVVNY